MKIAILTAYLLAHGALFRKARGTLPPWASEFDATTWAQFFLKFVLGDESITAVMLATNNPLPRADNLGAGRGKLPNATHCKQMVQLIESLG